jgi:hypothetical protein
LKPHICHAATGIKTIRIVIKTIRTKIACNTAGPDYRLNDGVAIMDRGNVMHAHIAVASDPRVVSYDGRDFG